MVEVEDEKDRLAPRDSGALIAPLGPTQEQVGLPFTWPPQTRPRRPSSRLRVKPTDSLELARRAGVCGQAVVELCVMEGGQEEP